MNCHNKYLPHRVKIISIYFQATVLIELVIWLPIQLWEGSMVWWWRGINLFKSQKEGWRWPYSRRTHKTSSKRKVWPSNPVVSWATGCRQKQNYFSTPHHKTCRHFLQLRNKSLRPNWFTDCLMSVPQLPPRRFMMTFSKGRLWTRNSTKCIPLQCAAQVTAKN